jgi:penicillin amidase
MRLKRVISVFMVVIVLVVGVVFVLLMASLPKEDGEISLPGLGAAATVHSDALGIPSIIAENREDAFRLLGFLHARDRLFQMELMRRKSTGRLAEIFGAKVVDLDKGQRDYQFERTAKNIVSALPGKQKQVLDDYVAGVNAFIDQTKILPPEFIALNFRPEPWRAEDTILVALGMYQTLNGQEQDERMVTVMENALPKQLVVFLTPDTDVYATVLIGGSASHRPAQSIPVSAFAALDAVLIKLVKGSVDVDSSIAGSNNWVWQATRQQMVGL